MDRSVYEHTTISALNDIIKVCDEHGATKEEHDTLKLLFDKYIIKPRISERERRLK